MLSRKHGVAFCLALRADARSGQLIRAWCCQPCCPPTALQRAPRQMTERKSHRGRDGAFVAHGAPKTTAASWNHRPKNPSAVSAHQAGRPWQPRGIGGGPTTGHRLAVERRRWAASSFSLKNKIDFRRAELEMLFLRELGWCNSSCLAHRVGRQPPVTAHSFSSLAPRQVSRPRNRGSNGNTPAHGHRAPFGGPSGLSRPRTP